MFRVLEALDAYGFTATIALDALTAQLCPQLLPHILRRGFEIVGHGQSVSRMISSRMSVQQEVDYIRASLETLERMTGIAPKGWHGPEYGESARTPALLAQLGINYLLDWPNEERPIVMDTEHGPITSIPMLVDFDDVYALYQRRLTVARWGQAVEEGIDQLVADAGDGGRLLVINLHPWLIGHPFRIGVLEDVLSHLAGRKELWLATTGEIASWFASSYQRQEN
jgi:peptidoglycan/xylan/chitin deacetylase (PgdA/CDA1 family)